MILNLAGQQQSRQNRMTFSKRIQPVQTRQCIAASAEAGFIEPEASKDSQLLTLDYSFTFELVLWCFSDVSWYMCCQKKASFEGEVRGAEAAEHPPARVCQLSLVWRRHQERTSLFFPLIIHCTGGTGKLSTFHKI